MRVGWMEEAEEFDNAIERNLSSYTSEEFSVTYTRRSTAE